MTDAPNRRRFLATAAAAATGIVGVSSRVVRASQPDSSYTTELTCIRDAPGGSPIDTVNANTGGYVVDGPVSDGGFAWYELSFNEDGDGGYNHCMAETDGTTTGWVEGATLTSADFAYPVNGTVLREWRQDDHESLDVAATAGRSVYAVGDGRVATAESVADSPCGRHVVVDHGNGWTTSYCHLRDVSVSEGESVSKAAEVGTVGSTGDATRSHVAFQIRRDGSSQPVPGVVDRQLLAMAGVPRDYR